MGSSNTKDANVDIYLEVEKQFYRGGEVVNGNVYINAKTQLNYTALYVRFEGHQYCCWSESHNVSNYNHHGSHKQTRYYQGKKQIYKDEFILARFDSGLRAGQYNFPFTFTLNPYLPGSYHKIGNNNFQIYFPLIASLKDFTGKNNPQQYSFNLTINQALRIPPNVPINLEHIAYPKSWCISKGQSKINVNIPSYYAKSGDKIKLNINLDNRNCKQKINSVVVKINQVLYAYAEGRFKNWVNNVYQLQTFSVEAGKEEKSEVMVQIPNIRNSTAVGQIVGNYYLLTVTGNIGGCTCCVDQPNVSKQIFIQALNPQLEPKQIVTPPLGWNPILANKIVYQGGQPYQHIGNPSIPKINRP